MKINTGEPSIRCGENKRIVVSKTRKINILFLIPSLRGGGAERVIANLLRNLDRNRYELALGVLNASDAVYLDEIADHVEFIDIGISRVRYALPKISALIWKRRPDIVFSTLGHLNLALSMVRPLLPNGIRYIARETSIVSFTLQSYRTPWFWITLYRWFYSRHDLVICQSFYMQKDLVENFGFPYKKSIVINNPVDIYRIKKLASAPLDVFTRNPGCIYFVAAGRLSEEKGFDLLVDAMAGVRAPEVVLFILGAGPLLDDLKNRALAKGVDKKIKFVGFQSNPYAWFARADALLLSSRFEGFPNVVLEALACGTPVISTPMPGGTREILAGIRECVVAGELSAQSLADAINIWLCGSRKRIETVALEPYRLDRIVGQYQKALG